MIHLFLIRKEKRADSIQQNDGTILTGNKYESSTQFTIEICHSGKGREWFYFSCIIIA